MQATRILVAALVELAITPLVPLWWAPIHLWIAIVTLIVGLSVAARWTPLLGKRADGTFPWWSYVLWWPWHLVVRISAWWFRNRGGGPLTEIHPDLWLGAWPHRTDVFARWPAIVDLTCELPRVGPASSYLCLPTWDVTVPLDQAVDEGVAFILECLERGEPVLVHCAHGRGRSTMVMLAALVEADLHPTWPEALEHVRRVRPHVRLSAGQTAALDRWSTRRKARLTA